MGLQLFDQYTYLHFATGIIVYFWNISFFQWIIIHSIFELLENTDIGVRTINQLISFWPGGKPYADGWMNQIGDTIGALLGWLSSYYLDQIGAENKWYEKHLSN